MFGFGDFDRSIDRFTLNREIYMNSDAKPTTKLTARQLTLEKMKKSGEISGNKTFFSKKLCKFCLHKHLTPVSECKHCRMPFHILYLFLKIMFKKQSK